MTSSELLFSVLSGVIIVLSLVLFASSGTIDALREQNNLMGDEIYNLKFEVAGLRGLEQPNSPSADAMDFVPETISSFPESVYIQDENGRNYAFHFKDSCIIAEEANATDCGGWVRDTYGWQNQIFFNKQWVKDTRDLFDFCNHERTHFLWDLGMEVEHEKMEREGVPEWKLCHNLIDEARTWN